MGDRQFIRPKGIPSGEAFGTPSVLQLPLYTTGEAARLLQIPASTVTRWIRGHGDEAPIIEPNDVDPDAVTWGQFIEAGLLREYRRQRISLQQLRGVIGALREQYDITYPLAHFRPWAENSKQLLFDVQRTLNLDERLYLVVPLEKHHQEGLTWQLTWTPIVESFLQKVEFSPELDIAVRLFPLGHGTPIAIDPSVQFGIPHVRGFRTETIAEAFATGDSEEDIAETWGLTIDEVRAAIRWELQTAA